MSPRVLRAAAAALFGCLLMLLFSIWFGGIVLAANALEREVLGPEPTRERDVPPPVPCAVATPGPGPAPATPVPGARPVRSSIGARLLFTRVSAGTEPAAWVSDNLARPGNSDVKKFMIGDPLHGAIVVGIEEHRVLLLNGPRLEFIDDSHLIPLDEWHEMDEWCSSHDGFAMQARIVPAFRNGVIQGFKLFSIRPDSIYSRMRLRNGDIVKRINGHALDSPEKALEISSQLRDARRFDLEFEREGVALRRTYKLTARDCAAAR